MSTLRGVGRFASWDGGCLLIGRSHATVPVHAHYAIQVTFGATPGVRFRPGDDDPWTSYTGALIASRQPHSMDSTPVELGAVILVEPETREGRALAQRIGEAGIAALPDGALDEAGPAVFAAMREGRADAELAAAARGVVRALAGGVAPTDVSDERVLRAMAYVKAHIDRGLTLEEVAAEACLSPGRFRHLFVEQTGMALRAYILWRRFVRVWELIARGEPLSAAAHEAGFADAAHLSRTCNSMFGFPPSALQVTRADAREA